MDQPYGNWTVQKLKLELVRRGAAVSGRKNDLVERLESYDRNQNFANTVDIQLPPSTEVCWPSDGYTSVNTSHQTLVHSLNQHAVRSYFCHRQAVDLLSEGNIQALDKGQLLLDSGRVEACSIHNAGMDVFFTGMVRAAMKKKISYNFKLRLDVSGSVINSHCECPAGKGPHGTCKHVAAVLLMLTAFAQGGKLSVSHSCTDKLQTFHKPKRRHDGSPLKSDKLPSKCSKGSLDDPRPPQLRNLAGYEDHVRSTVMNYCSNTGHDLTIRYLYEKADLRAAVHDHRYMTTPFTEFWVNSALQVTADRVRQIESDTRLQARSSLWHMERRWRITASRFGDIALATDRRCKEKLCRSLLKPAVLRNRAVLHGQQNEAVARSQFEKLYGLKVQPAGFFICIEHPWLGASPDGVIDEEHIIEIKCPYKGRNSKIEPSPEFPFLERYDNVVRLKQHSKYYCQVQGQLYITGRKICKFFVFTLTDVFLQDIVIDMQYCTESLLPKLDCFYHRYFRQYIAKSLE